MISKLFFISIQALVASANPGFMDALGYPQPTRAPLPTGFVHPAIKPRDINDCSTAYSAIAFCESVTPGFTTLPETRQAPCLCYSSASWRPDFFDNAVSNCATYARTASPSDYSAIAALNSFCTSVGDVAAQATGSSTRGGGGGGGGSNPTACSVVASAISYCNSVSPGFTTMPVSSQAPCLCYSSRVWRPDFFDGVVETCANFAQTASPSDFSAIRGLNGFCTSAGDVLGPATASASVTRSPTITSARGTATGLVANSACSFVGSAISFCNSLSPGFTSMDPTSQAPCLCYSSGTWRPTGFDGPVSTCADFVKTAQPSDYALFSNLAGFCTDVGDISAGAAPTRSGGGGGGMGGIIGDVFSASNSPTGRSTVTIQQPEPTTTRSPGAGVPSALVGSWALRGIFGVMAMFFWL